MPPKHRCVSDDDERPSNVVVPKRKLTGRELSFFLRAKGQQIGYVTRGQPHEGQPVFASVGHRSEVTLHLEGETLVSAEQVDWFESSDEKFLEKQLVIFYQKTAGFRYAMWKGLFCEFEFFEMREYPPALDVGYALMRHHYLIRRRSGVLPAERGLIPDTFDKDLELAEGLLNKLIAAFPEEKKSLNPLSVARAAGYYTKFRDHFPDDLRGPANDSRYDIYLLKASKKFWMEMTNQHADSNEQYSDEDKSDDEPASWANKKRKTSAPEKELFSSPASNPDAFATDYRMYDRPQFLTEERLSKHKAIVRGPKGMKWLHTLSPVFSTIPGDNRISNGAREHYAPKADKLRPDPIGIQTAAAGAIKMFSQPPLFTRHFEEVWKRFSGDEKPKFLEGGLPTYKGDENTRDPMQKAHHATYNDYIKKCAQFAPNAISVLFISKMNDSIKDPKAFRKWKEALDHCLENDLLVISDSEREKWEAQQPRNPVRKWDWVDGDCDSDGGDW